MIDDQCLALTSLEQIFWQMLTMNFNTELPLPSARELVQDLLLAAASEISTKLLRRALLDQSQARKLTSCSSLDGPNSRGPQGAVVTKETSGLVK